MQVVRALQWQISSGDESLFEKTIIEQIDRNSRESEFSRLVPFHLNEFSFSLIFFYLLNFVKSLVSFFPIDYWLSKNAS